MRDLQERVEQKFFVEPRRFPLALALVRRTCRWDEDYPEEQINSLYFDTCDLDEHERSDSGEFGKAKVRIRWYGTEHDPHKWGDGGLSVYSPRRYVPTWVELKERRGFASTKQRRSIEVMAEAVGAGALVRGIIPANELATTMADFGYFSPKPLLPVIAISYWRRRFVEPSSGFRVAIDCDIRSSAVMPGLGRKERGLRLAGAVVEVKGPVAGLPAGLHDLGELGSSWTRFSKYSSSIDAHQEDLGSVSRLWPSGLLHAQASTTVA